MAVKNIEASVLARLKQQAKNEGIAFQTVLQLFCQEEFLRRLSVSQYAENFILKGGMFIYTITEFQSRPTRDIDFLMRKLSDDLDNIERIMTEICAADTGNEFIILDVLSTERITVDKKNNLRIHADKDRKVAKTGAVCYTCVRNMKCTG